MNSIKLTLKALISKVLNNKLLSANKMLFKGLFSKMLAIKVAATSVLLTLIVVVFSASISANDKVHNIAQGMTEGIWLTGTDGGKIATYQKGGQ